MVLLVVIGTVNWNEPEPPVTTPAVFTYGPCTLTELCRVKEPVLSYGSVVVKLKRALVLTSEMPDKAGWGALTLKLAERTKLPAALVMVTLYVVASANCALVIVRVPVVTPA